MTNSATPTSRASVEKVLLVSVSIIAITKAIDFVFYGYALHNLGASIGLALMSYGMFASVRSRQSGASVAAKYPFAGPLSNIGCVLAVISYAAKYLPW